MSKKKKLLRKMYGSSALPLLKCVVEWYPLTPVIDIHLENQSRKKRTRATPFIDVRYG